jgi:hypothetical protein
METIEAISLGVFGVALIAGIIFQTINYKDDNVDYNNEQAMIDYNKMEEESEIDNYNEMNNEQQ